MKKLFLVLLLLAIAVSAFAMDTPLSWDASPSDINGYIVHYSNGTENYSVDVGNVLTYTIKDLPAGNWSYYVTAYKLDVPDPSVPSNVVSNEIKGYIPVTVVHVPAVPPDAPGTLRIVVDVTVGSN